jgi:hypothetical protein
MAQISDFWKEVNSGENYGRTDRDGQKVSGEKIDMFCHILPGKFKEALFKIAPSSYYIEADGSRPALFDVDVGSRSWTRSRAFVRC